MVVNAELLVRPLHDAFPCFESLDAPRRDLGLLSGQDLPRLGIPDEILLAQSGRRLELEPGVHFPSEHDHDATFRFTVRLEGIFGYNTTVDINENFMPVKAPWDATNQSTD